MNDMIELRLNVLNGINRMIGKIEDNIEIY